MGGTGFGGMNAVRLAGKEKGAAIIAMETPLCWKCQYYGKAEIWRGANLSLQNKLYALSWQCPRSRDPCALCSSEDHGSVPDLGH